MRTTFIFLLITCSTLSLISQDVHDRKVQESFLEYKTAYLDEDKTELLRFIHPYVIQVSGGESYVISDITTDYNMYASTGLVIADILLKQGSKIIQVGEDLQAMYPYERHLKKAKEELVEKGFYLVVSTDQGQSWTFTDMKKYDRESIKIFVPNYNERFNIYLNSTH